MAESTGALSSIFAFMFAQGWFGVAIVFLAFVSLPQLRTPSVLISLNIHLIHARHSINETEFADRWLSTSPCLL
jgi:hypothetical protein